MFNCIEAFKSKMAEVGLTPPPDIIGDSKIHRFATNNKRGGGDGDKAGWYVFHQQPVPTGCFGDWRTGQSGSWSAKSRHDMTVSEVKEYHACLARAKQQREEEHQKIRREAKAKAQVIYQQANPAGEHPYLIVNFRPNRAESLCLMFNTVMANSTTTLGVSRPSFSSGSGAVAP